MSEMMALELLVEAEYILRDYWTKGRFPVQTALSGWSDFDVVAFNPHVVAFKPHLVDPNLEGKSHLVLSEAKAYGTKNQVYVTTVKNQDMTLSNIDNLWSLAPKDNDPYFRFLYQIKEIKGSLLKLIQESVQIVTIQIASNWIVDQGVKGNIESKLAEKVKEISLMKDKTVICSIETPMEIFSRIMMLEHEKDQGRRYGNPILDLAREFNRYLDPSYLHKRKFSRKKEFQKYTNDLFSQMFHMSG